MPVTSAAMLPYLVDENGLQVWIAHMGGPFWAKKDDASWTVVKGEYELDEDPEDAARREWREETGTRPPDGAALLGSFPQSSRKTVTVYAARVQDPGDVELRESATIALEWPPRSGRQASFPELDRAEWFPVDVARLKILRGQVQILDALAASLAGSAP